MSIKRSSLEKVFYYRIAKVMFFILPLIVVYYYFSYKAVIGYFIYLCAGLILWRIALYIFFGGFEDDTKKPPTHTPAHIQTPTPIVVSAQKHSSDDGGLGVLFVVIIIVLAISYVIVETPSNTITNNNGSSNGTNKGGTVTTKYCNPGNTYNYSSQTCCPNVAPHYYPGTHGLYDPGCYATCPYVGDCSSRTTRY